MVQRSTNALLGLQQAVDPRRERLKQIQARWAQFPGSGPRGTGSTGLASNDFAGWVKQQNENFEGQNLERELAGQAPLQHRFGGEIDPSSEMPTTVWDPLRQQRIDQYHHAPVGTLADEEQVDAEGKPIGRASRGSLDALKKAMGR